MLSPHTPTHTLRRDPSLSLSLIALYPFKKFEHIEICILIKIINAENFIQTN